MKTHTKDDPESLSTAASIKLMALAIAVIAAILVTLLAVDRGRHAGGELEVNKPVTEEDPSTNPEGGPYVPYPDPGLVSAPSTSSTANSLGSVDRVLASMNWANIAFNAPEKIRLNDSAQIHLLLSLQKSMDELRAEINAAGKREGARIRVSNRMEAHLSSQEGTFKILSITPEEQAIGSIGTFEWKWEVEPLIPGVHTLYLNVIAHFSVDGVPASKSIKTFERKIEVEVSTSQWVSEFYEKNWQWLWVVFLIPAAGWLWKRGRRLWELLKSTWSD